MNREQTPTPCTGFVRNSQVLCLFVPAIFCTEAERPFSDAWQVYVFVKFSGAAGEIGTDETTLTKEMFLNHLYGGMDEPEVKIIDVFICKLRKKLALATEGANYIETVWGRGYVLRDPQPQPTENIMA